MDYEAMKGSQKLRVPSGPVLERVDEIIVFHPLEEGI